MSNRFGVSSWLPPAATSARTGYSVERDRTFDKPHTHSCGFDGLAEHFQTGGWEAWTCPRCREVVVVYDETDTLRDGGELEEAHVDEDGLDGPAERFPYRGREAS